MKIITKIFESINFIPSGIKLITYATAVRWIGWGLFEPLVPVFIATLSGSMLIASLVKSSYDIVYIVSILIIGHFSKKVNPLVLILIGLILYIFIGVLYTVAAATGLLLYLLVARFLNGISYSLDTLGRDYYFKKHISDKDTKRSASIFGYFDTVSNFWWIIAALVGAVLITFLNIKVLMFSIVPTSVISLLIVVFL